MIVSLTIVVIIAISILIPKHYLKRYYIISAVVLSSLYLFADPTESDLSRLYGMADAIQNASIEDIVLMRKGDYGNYLLNLYMTRYMIFNLYTKAVSVLPRNFFVFLPALMIYLIPLIIIFDDIHTRYCKKWVYVVSYSAFLLCIDYLSISAIRNISVAMLFFFILVNYDLNGRWKKLYCFIGYLVLTLIHSYAVVLIMLRLLIVISNKYTKYILAILISLGYALLISGNSIVYWVFGQFDFLLNILERLVQYSSYTETTVEIKRSFMLMLYILILFISFLSHLFTWKALDKNDRLLMTKLFDFLLFSTFFTLGAYAQYDLFIRGSLIIFPVWIMTVTIGMKAIGKQPFGVISFNRKQYSLVNAFTYFCNYIICFLIFGYLIRVGYLWMDDWFF